MRPSALYSITHRASGREYIGITCNDVRQRWNAHVSACQRLHTPMARALRKYGSRAFDFQVEAMLPTVDEAKIAEMIAIATRKPAFNVSRGGDGTFGIKHPPRSDAWRAKQRAARSGRPSGRNHIAKAVAVSADTRRGKPNPRHAEVMRGRRASPETRAKMSASQRARRAAESASK